MPDPFFSLYSSLIEQDDPELGDLVLNALGLRPENGEAAKAFHSLYNKLRGKKKVLAKWLIGHFRSYIRGINYGSHYMDKSGS